VDCGTVENSIALGLYLIEIHSGNRQGINWINSKLLVRRTSRRRY
jgi:hypothetical protein